MKLNELIMTLQELELQGYGENKVVIACYDEEFEPKPFLGANGDVIL